MWIWTLTWAVGSLMCMCDLFACTYTQETSVYSVVWRTFVEYAQNFMGGGGGSGWVQCLAHKGHPSAGIPLVSILRRSLGLPATALRGSLGNFKGSSLIWNSSCAEVFCFAYDALRPLYISVLGSVLSDNVTFSCTLLGMLAYYSSNRFIQRPILVVLHDSSILVVGSPASSVDVFYSIHLSVWKGFFK